MSNTVRTYIPTYIVLKINIFRIAYKLLLIGKFLLLTLILRKLWQRIKTNKNKRQINIQQENVENPKPWYNNQVLNPERFNYKSVAVYVAANLAMMTHVYIFNLNHDYFSSEFHYFMNDQFLHFVFFIYVPLITYALNKRLRTFVKDEFF